MTPDPALPSGHRYDPASDTSKHCCVINKLREDVACVGGSMFVGEQSVEVGAEDASLWGASIC